MCKNEGKNVVSSMDDPWGKIKVGSSDAEFPFHSKSGKEGCAENAVLT